MYSLQSAAQHATLVLLTSMLAPPAIPPCNYIKLNKIEEEIQCGKTTDSWKKRLHKVQLQLYSLQNIQYINMQNTTIHSCVPPFFCKQSYQFSCAQASLKAFRLEICKSKQDEVIKT